MLIKFINIKLSLITTPSRATIPIKPVIEIGSPLTKTPIVTPIMVKRGAIVLLKNESLGSHHHINEWDYNNSPEISVLYCLTKEEKNASVVFEYEFGRNKKLRWKEDLQENKLIIFPSYLKHFIPKNINDKAVVALSFQFQLL